MMRMWMYMTCRYVCVPVCVCGVCVCMCAIHPYTCSIHVYGCITLTLANRIAVSVFHTTFMPVPSPSGAPTNTSQCLLSGTVTEVHVLK